MTPLSYNYGKIDNEAIKGGTNQVGDSKTHNHFFRKQFNFLLLYCHFRPVSYGEPTVYISTFLFLFRHDVPFVNFWLYQFLNVNICCEVFFDLQIAFQKWRTPVKYLKSLQFESPVIVKQRSRNIAHYCPIKVSIIQFEFICCLTILSRVIN